jgi:hypothetical protein
MQNLNYVIYEYFFPWQNFPDKNDMVSKARAYLSEVPSSTCTLTYYKDYQIMEAQNFYNINPRL